MANLDWGSINTHLSSLGEDLNDGYEQQEEVSEHENMPEGEEVNPLSEAQLAIIADMLEVSIKDLLAAPDEMIAEAMEYVASRVMATKYSEEYGRPGLTGRYPWDMNEQPVVMTSPVAAPSMDGPPGTARARSPNAGTSPVQ